MRGLSAEEMLRIWEQGARQSPVRRGLTLLAAGLPEASIESLAALSLGRRNGGLLRLREATFGPRLNCLSACPDCGETLEFALDVRQLLDGAGTETPEAEYSLSIDGATVRFRLPDSRDLAALAGCADVAAARALLIHHCLLSPTQEDDASSSTALPESVLQTIEQRMAELDPLAEIELRLECPHCQQAWLTLFDIASTFWEEVSAEARRLLREIHHLARAYGWREADILAMSATRRALYLEMTGE